MAAHLTEDEELQALKQWWQKNGIFTILLVIIGVGGYFGWQFWQNHQQRQAEAAAAIYDELLQAVAVAPGQSLTEEKRKTANYLIDQLKNEHSGSFYALGGAMYGAKIALEADKLDSAVEHLTWALEQSDASETDNILRLRLARLMNELTDYEQALIYSQYDATDAFTALFAMARGDAYLGKGDIQAAKAAYQLALDNAFSPRQQQRQLLEMKIANLPNGSIDPSSANKQVEQSVIDSRSVSE